MDNSDFNYSKGGLAQLARASRKTSGRSSAIEIMDEFRVYILYSESRDRYYIGASANVENRLSRHNAGATKSTKSGRPWKIVHTELFETYKEALVRERAIKAKKSRKYIDYLITQKGD